MPSPASDPRQTDTDLVRRLLDKIPTMSRTVDLPAMTAAELFALGALAHPLLDARALNWWNAQPDQDSAVQRGYDRLAERDLIDPVSHRLAPLSGLVIAGRSRPAFILVARSQPDADPGPARAFGIADEASGLRAVLMEAVSPRDHGWAGPGYSYVLAGATTASREFADWAAERKQRTLDLYLPGSETKLPSMRFVVAPALRRLHVERVTSAGALGRVTCSKEELGDMINDAMTEACK